MLVLSLFPGIGLLDRAFEEVGFCVVRGPDILWGGDIRRFHPPPGVFDGVIGGPPCQAFSSLSHMVRHNGYEPKFGNLIPEFERVVCETQPRWWLMENVIGAPLPVVDGRGVHSFVLDNRQLGEKQSRKRRFSFGWHGGRRILGIDVVVFENPEYEYAACGGGYRQGGLCNGNDPRSKRARERKARMAEMGFRTRNAFRDLCRRQGLPDDFALPPFTVAAACQAVGNGVPLTMGRAVAKAVKEICDREREEHEGPGERNAG